jgi:hypothetical protein
LGERRQSGNDLCFIHITNILDLGIYL